MRCAMDKALVLLPAVIISAVVVSQGFGQSPQRDASTTSAQGTATRPEPTAPKAPAEGDKPGGGKSLDELLGIEGDGKKGGSATEAATRDNDELLKRELTETEIVDHFAQAIDKMSLSAELLDNKFDPGLGTQRVQEDIIAKLALLIDQSKKKQSKSGSPSPSRSNPQPQNQQNDPGKQQSKQPTPPGEQRNSKASDSREGTSPPLQEGDINTVLDETRSEWGNLPPRVRDTIIQGRQGKFSSMYKKLTEEYYRRLAEEGSP